MSIQKNSKISLNCGGGILVPGLTFLFVAAKIFGYINWSWWWVLSPLWISWILFIITFIVIIILKAWAS